jgi:hypothetical protein
VTGGEIIPALPRQARAKGIRMLWSRWDRPAPHTAEVTPVGEIIGELGHYRFTPGALCRLIWEDFDRWSASR